MAFQRYKSALGEHWFFSEIVAEASALARTVFLNILGNIFQIVTSLFVMVVYNNVLPYEAKSSLLTLVIGISVILGFDLISKILKSRIVGAANDKIEAHLQKRLFDKVLSWDLQSRPKFAGAASTLMRDIESTTELFTNNSISTVVGVPFVFVNCVVIYLIAGPLVWVTLTILALAIMVSILFFFLVSNLAGQAKNTSVEKNSVFLEAITNLETLKSIADYEFFKSRFKVADEEARAVSERLKYLLSDANSFNNLLSSSAQIAVVSVGAILVIEGIINPGALIASMILNGKTLQPVMQIAGLLQKLSVAKVAYKKLDQTFSFVSDEERRWQNISIEKLVGPIKVKDLSFQPEGIQTPVLNVKNLTIKAGEKVGVVGSVGSGKSTFLKLISGVLTPTSGRVSYGAFDTTAINQSNLRKSVSYLGQETGIFSGSIRDNLTFGDESISDDRIVQAMDVTGFSSVIQKFPNGLSFVISEKGQELSGGQKQILALTRSVLSDPTFLVYDEPTSAMDPRHENLFIRKMSSFLDSKTFIVVTHRRPILALTDRLIVIENGAIILDGKRDDVLAKFR